MDWIEGNCIRYDTFLLKIAGDISFTIFCYYVMLCYGGCFINLKFRDRWLIRYLLSINSFFFILIIVIYKL